MYTPQAASVENLHIFHIDNSNTGLYESHIKHDNIFYGSIYLSSDTESINF